jgi:hypothetical protein
VECLKARQFSICASSAAPLAQRLVTETQQQIAASRAANLLQQGWSMKPDLQNLICKT